MERLTFSLMLLLATLSISSSDSVFYKQYGCESLFTTNITTMSTLVTFENVRLNQYYNRSVSDFPIVFTIPMTEIKWKVSYQSKIQTFSAPAPVTCCKAYTDPRSINCIITYINCTSSPCSLTKPRIVYNDFYTMNCKDCGCTYCYKGGPARRQLFQVNLKQQDYIIVTDFSAITKLKTELIKIPSNTQNKVIKSFNNDTIVDYSNPPFLFTISNNTIHVNTSSNDFTETKYSIYIKDIVQRNIQEVELYFYPSTQCKISGNTITNVQLNVTVILFINCKNVSTRALIYQVSDPHYNVRDGKMYLVKAYNKTIPPFILSIQYSGVNESMAQWLLNITLIIAPTNSSTTISDGTTTPTVTVTPVYTSPTNSFSTTIPKVNTNPQVIRITAELKSNRKITFTCYTNYNSSKVKYQWFISNKRVNGATNQILKSGRSQESITVQNKQFVSGNKIPVNCEIKNGKLQRSLTATFDVQNFPYVQLTAPSTSQSHSDVNYTCTANISKASVQIFVGNSYIAAGSSYKGSFIMKGDTNISCFAIYNNYTGPRKEKIVYLYNEKGYGVSSQMISSNKILFMCYSTGNTTYQWYLNDTIITTEINEWMANNHTMGQLIITNVSRHDNFKISCRGLYRNLTVHERSVNISISSIPQVSVISPNISSFNTVVYYTCATNVPNAVISIAVVPSNYSHIGYSIRKVGNYIGNFTILYDTKIYCYATYNNQRGVIKEVLVKVNMSSMYGVGTTMHSNNNITFTCYSNSTFAETMYQWYLNDNIITTGIQKKMLGNQTFGYLTLTNFSENANVKIMCQRRYRNMIDERTINISISSIPQVILIYKSTAVFQSIVYYVCGSNVPNSDIYVAVIPLSYRNISYSVKKASYTGNFTILYDTKIYCYASYNDQRGIIKEVLVKVNMSSMYGVGTTMHSNNNITFTCYSNSTFAETMYQWYLNDNIITTGIQKRMLGNQTFGYLTLTNFSENANVKITCKLLLKTLSVDERSINISISSIPQVSLISQNISLFNSVVNYSCATNVPNADIYLAVIPLNYKDISYRVKKANYTGNFTILYDTKIYCYASYNDQRGIIKEVLVKVNMSSMYGVGTTMHSNNNITFTCYSNSTFAETMYQWYLNDNIITTGIQKRMLGNHAFGYLTLTNFSENANVKITCKLVYKTWLVDERSINISISSIPQVSIISQNISLFNSVVNYSCATNVPNADIYVAVIPLNYKDISYRVKKANYTGNFTILYDTKIYCYASYNDQRGIIKEVLVKVNMSSMYGVGTTMHSNNNITFTCYSNSTFAETMYQWYLNDNIITTGIQKRMLGNQTFGYLTLTNFSENANVKITCKLLLKTLSVDERSINISISSIPQVSLISQNISLFNSVVNYSCATNVPNADIYLAVIPLNYKDISYRVKKANYTGNFTILYDTKIYCYASYNDQRGIIKEVLVKVNMSSMYGVGTTMHSNNNITFTCYSNSTFAETMYQWYLNDNIITTGIQKRMLGNHAFGYLTLTNFSENANVKITCKLVYKTWLVDERSINISISSIPQVSIISQNISLFNSVVNYSCATNVPNADIYVAVIPLNYKDISYRVKKANYTGNFTILYDTKIYCYASYNDQRGIIKEVLVKVNMSSMYGVGTTMHSNNNITFTCYSNSTFAETTYQWYLNDNNITTGIQKKMLGNQTFGYLTLTNFSENANVKIMCQRLYRNMVDERTINISLSSIPQVSLISQSTALFQSIVYYSCGSNVPNSDIYVAVIPLSYRNISYSVKKANYTGNFTILYDTKIYCFASYNDQRGIIKENLVLLQEVKEFSILRISTTMHSIKNITFTCYTNSSSTAVTYKWYLNMTGITARIRQRMVNNQSQSDVTLTTLSQKDSVNIMCRTFYANILIDERSMNQSISTIPQVSIISQNLSLSNSVVNYSCISNVRNADIYLAVVSLPHQKRSYSVKKANYTGNFTMVTDTKIFCYAEYGNKRGIIKSQTVYLAGIKMFSILRISTTMHSIKNITFTCYTNSSSTAVTYKWYLNMTGITARIRQRMVNNQSQSDVTLTTLSQKDSGWITCEAFYRSLQIDKRKIYTTVSSIPQVTINVYPMSLVNSVVNYNCISSVRNATVYVTVKYTGSSETFSRISNYTGNFQMLTDTSISCYAATDLKNGMVKEKVVVLARIQKFSILKITTTMHSIDNIEFACYTNSSSTDITYKWYLNNSVVTTEKKQMMINQQSVGYVNFTNLRQKDIGWITCEAYFKILRIDKQRINLSVSKIPAVTITSAKVANINTMVAYSCDSNIKDASVYLYYQYSNVKKQFTKKSSLTGEFLIKSDTTISCYSELNLIKGPGKETIVFVSKGKQTCPKETKENVVWPKTLAEKEAEVSCPESFEGSVTRKCNKDGQWGDPDLSNCVKTVIIDAAADLNKISNGLSKDLATPVKTLATATNTTLKKKELVMSIQAIDMIVEITKDFTEFKEEEVTNFFEISSNLLKEENKASWVSIDNDKVKQVKNTPQNMMKNIEKFAAAVADKINKTLIIQKNNLIVEIQKVSVEKNLRFPSQSKTNTPTWVQESFTSADISSDSLKEIFGVNKIASVVATLFKSISDILPGETEKDFDLNSYVLSITFGQSTIRNLDNPIILTFQHTLPDFSNPLCSFWDFNLINTTGGGWSSEGCYLNSTNSTSSKCACNHLTNFAILMNPWTDVKQVYALRLLTTIGCWISVISLVFTLLTYVTCWKHVASRDVTSSRSVLLINLCVALIAVYLIFMFGIESTNDKGVCTAVSILLLYFLLAAFFSMLAEGIDISIALTYVFTFDTPRLPWLIALCWGGPAIIVGISLGATRLEGFGNNKFCWLDRENGLIWAFVGPVTAIILANIVCGIFVLRALMSAGTMLRRTTAERVKKGARAILVLSPLLGFTWIIGLFAVNDDTVVFEYIFTILATLQGFFIFLAYCAFNLQLRKAFSESKFRSQYLSTKVSNMSQSKTNRIDSSISSNTNEYNTKMYDNIKRNSDFNIRKSGFDIKKK